MTKHKKVTERSISQAAIYIRVSTEDQAANGFGLEVQIERCKAQATVKGWIVDTEKHVYADEGISGTKDQHERPGLAAMLRAVDNCEVDAVIVLALDRLGRSMKIVLDLVDRIVKAGCELVSCKESLDTSTPAGMFVVQMFAAIAQLDHANIVKRLTDGRNARYRISGDRGGRLPYGYTRSIDGIEIDHPAADAIRSIFEQRSQGAKLRTIAARLSTQHIAPRGQDWHIGTIKKILDKECTYRGRRGPGDAPWPIILFD